MSKLILLACILVSTLFVAQGSFNVLWTGSTILVGTLRCSTLHESILYVVSTNLSTTNGWRFTHNETRSLRAPSPSLVAFLPYVDTTCYDLIYLDDMDKLVYCAGSGVRLMSPLFSDLSAPFAVPPTSSIYGCSLDTTANYLWVDTLTSSNVRVLEAFDLNDFDLGNPPILSVPINTTMCPIGTSRLSVLNGEPIIICQENTIARLKDGQTITSPQLGAGEVTSVDGFLSPQNRLFLNSRTGLQLWNFDPQVPDSPSIRFTGLAYPTSGTLAADLNPQSGVVYLSQGTGTAARFYQTSSSPSIFSDVSKYNVAPYSLSASAFAVSVHLIKETGFILIPYRNGFSGGLPAYGIALASSSACSAAATCGECLAQQDYECGWCLNGREGGSCGRASECTSRWISEACPALNAVTTGSPAVTGLPFAFELSTSSAFTSQSGVTCVLNNTASNTVVPLEILSVIPPTCGISSETSSALSRLSGQYQLEILLDNLHVFPSPKPVEFVNCSAYSSCGSCTSAHPECDWCSFDGICVNSGTACATAGPAFQRPTTPSACPVQTSISPTSIVLPLPTSASITVSATSLITPVAGASYACRFIFPSTNISTPGTFTTATSGISCPIPTPPSGFTGTVSVSLFFNRHPHAENTNSFSYYDCTSPTLNTCDRCIKATQPTCAWNAATKSCRFASNCAGSDCRSACPTLVSANSTSFFKSETGVIELTGTFWTSNSPSSWVCQFAGVASTTATFISNTILRCPIPVFTEQSYFTSTQTSFQSSLQVIHTGSNYSNPLPVNWYDCVGTSCATCLNNGNGPKCRWNPFASSCGFETASQLSTCPRIDSLSDDFSHITGGLSITVQSNGAIQAGLTYYCVWSNFDISGPGTIRQPATVSGSTWTCVSPDLTPYSPPASGVASNLSIEIDGPSSYLPYTANFVPFDFYDCAIASSCSSCLRSSQCFWKNYATCGASTTAGDIVLSGNCPLVKSVTPSFIQVSDDTLLTVEVENFPASWESYRCQWKTSAPATFVASVTQVNSTFLTCLFSSPFSDLKNDVLELSIVSNPGNLPVTANSVPFEVFDCEEATDCAACGNMMSQCGWCFDSGKCTTNSSCSAPTTWFQDSCPFVESVSPSYAALGYQRPINFTGDFLLSESPSITLFCRFSYGTPQTVLYTPVNIINTHLLSCDPPILTTPRRMRLALVQQFSSKKRDEVLIRYTDFSTEPLTYEYINCDVPPQNNVTSCVTCVTGTSDQRCGWCAFDAFCSDGFACSSQFPFHPSTGSQCPRIISIEPATGPLAGGTEITVTGSTFFPGTNTSCRFGNQVVPATVSSSTTLKCISPSASSLGIQTEGTPVSLRILLNEKDFTTSASIITFTYKNPGVATWKIALGVVLGVVGFLLIVLLILFVIFYRKIKQARDKTKFLKLRQPDYAKVAFSQTKGIDYILSPNDIKNLRNFISVLEADTEFKLINALSTAATGSQQDYLARAAVYFYHSRGKALSLLETFVSREVVVSEHEGTLFRASSFACKMFNQYARFSGLPYLWKTLGFYINQLAEFAKEERAHDREGILGPGTMEVDPGRFEEEDNVPDDLDIRLNQYELLARASKILKAIFGSLPNMRPEFRLLSQRVKNEVGNKFTANNADYKAVGGFIFLRLICPSIMAPHIYGLLEQPPNETAQRYFVLLSKSLQNLANETLPGTNEDFMAPINEFITKNIHPLHMWIDNLCHGADASVEVDEQMTIPEDLQNGSIAFLHNLLYEQWDATVPNLPEDMVESLERVKERGPVGKKPKDGKKSVGGARK